MTKKPELISELLSAKDYRAFLKAVITTNYAAFARRAGFSSRAFPRDVVGGKRRITAKTLPVFHRALGLKGDLKQYFTLLVACEESDVLPERLSTEEIRRKLVKVQERLQTSMQRLNQDQAPFPKVEKWMEIYSSLGTKEHGASIHEVSSRTGLPTHRCEIILKKMLEYDVVVYSSENNRYLAKGLHMIFESLGADEFFKSTYVTTLGEVEARAKKNFISEDQLFLNSVFSVDRASLPQLRKQLRELIVSFSDAAENSNGDGIAKVVVGLIGN